MELKKILIANRGEIAVRIIRTLRSMGIRSVAIYSTSDKSSLHVMLADEAYCVGPPEPLESYLNIDKIVEVAKKCGVDAVHPGYGFLSQNPNFVKRLEEEGIVFIGPPSRVHLFSGDKLGARIFLSRNSIPVIPGSLEPVDSLDKALSEAERIGYPVILKPRFGGGGTGMLVCRNAEELRENYKIASRLARSAFGYKDLYLEKYYSSARHIEVQILADKHGNVVHLFERECSIQRRFQKVIEETPSPALSDEIREKIYTTAVRIAELIGYVNAGTVEFLFVPEEERFYFMEINSRIQVEHPITEMITGVDIVREQVKIAAGERLSFSQNEIERQGCAVEARVYAEDPENNFAPSPGLVEEYYPPRGPWLRVDDYVYPGYEIPPYYDSLVAKVIAWGSSRDEAVNRLKVALEEYIIRGVKTNIPFLYSIICDEDFRRGNYTTTFLLEKEFLRASSDITKISISREKVEVVYKTGVSPWVLSGRIY
ncbi:MAG: acetyl-CoA carboxylase biotin carboxylase subunit [Thermoprotei archaeon]|nr:MAG: acetyl-CoA carboxylase biotin carboxylase subunit [Thermoprotei archaeon]RLF00160.1 MAG: acetyl-CoA carboxylase biotin carboxylase subunit [Thermoprotei archaeon]HDI74994.1 acetyl-CoA carboxylase biotin carboxylase subunit [Thermoprotei archaeon]